MVDYPVSSGSVAKGAGVTYKDGVTPYAGVVGSSQTIPATAIVDRAGVEIVDRAGVDIVTR